jgi:hypothetical protein
MKLLYSEKQLFWLNELDPNYYVCVKMQPVGVEKLNSASLVEADVIQIKQLNSFVSSYPDENIWRSWCVYKDKNRSEEIGPVPLILDVDDEHNPPNIDHAYIFTKTCVQLLQTWHNVIQSKDCIRIVFSGKKGFHIELKPAQPLDALDLRRKLLDGCEMAGLKRVFGNVFLENTSLDTINVEKKPWIRITDTIYSWYSKSGQLTRRKVFSMSVDELLQRDANIILSQSDCY